MKNIQYILIITLILLTTSFASEYGSISGYVVNEKYKLLHDVDIIIDGTPHKAETNSDGFYKILGIQAGSYTIRFLEVGFQPVNVHNVKVEPDSETEIIQCIFEEQNSDHSRYYTDYDGSNATITTNNQSQKNIDLEKTGKVDIKEKSKYPKPDFAERFHLLQKDKEGALPRFNPEEIIGIYQTGLDGYVEFNVINDLLFMNLYDLYSYIRNDSFRLYHKGNNVFFTKELSGEIIFKNNTLNFQINDPHFWIKPEKVFQKGNYNLQIPRLMAIQGKSDEAISMYRELLSNNPNSYYTNDDYLRSIQYHFIKNNLLDAAIIIGKVNVESHPNPLCCYYDLAEVCLKKNDIESAIGLYKICLDKAKESDKSMINSIIKDLEKKLKDKK